MKSIWMNKAVAILMGAVILTPLFSNASPWKQPPKINIVNASCTGWAPEDPGIAAVDDYLNDGYRLVSVVSLVDRTTSHGGTFSDNLCAYYLTK